MYTVLDALMCFFWIATYVFVFVGTVKYKYPLISPVSQTLFCANEIAVIAFFITESVRFNYAVVTYICWLVLEIAIFAALLRTEYYNKKYILPHLMAIAGITALFYYLIAVRGKMLITNYSIALVGVLFWLSFFMKKEYPLTIISLLTFICKFFADLVVVPFYLTCGGIFTDFICVILPCLDLLSIVLWFVRRKKRFRFKQ